MLEIKRSKRRLLGCLWWIIHRKPIPQCYLSQLSKSAKFIVGSWWCDKNGRKAMDKWSITCQMKVYLTYIYHQMHLQSFLFVIFSLPFWFYSHLPILSRPFLSSNDSKIIITWLHYYEKKSKANNRRRERAFLIDHQSEANFRCQSKSLFKNAPNFIPNLLSSFST